ncbi:MAG: hypothetical protein RI947_949 [Candidatus Parcubacteria bacterium]
MNMFFMRRYILLLLLIFLSALFLVSVYFNSSTYIVENRTNDVRVVLYDNVMYIPKTQPGEIHVFINTIMRHTVEQYLVEDKGFIINTFEILRHILLRDTPLDIVYKQPSNTTKRYIHYNPFKAELHIDSPSSAYQINMYLTESTIQLSSEHERLSSVKVKPPWMRLISMPLLTAFSLSAFFLVMIGLLPYRKQKLPETEHIPLSRIEALSRYLPLIIFLAGAAASLAVVQLVYHAMPGFGDEMNYLLQAKIFLAGKISVPQPPHPEFFLVDWMDMFGIDGKIWGFHGIGNSIILMIGWLTGVVWITIPVITGFIVVVQYYIAMSLFKNKRIAVIQILLMLTSHYFLTLSSSYMAHAPSMLFISLFFLCVIKSIQTGTGVFLLPAAVSIAAAFNTRPLSAVLAAIIPCLALLYHWYTIKKIPWKYVLGSLVTGLLIISMSYLYTYGITGKLELAYMVKGPEAGRTFAERWHEGWGYRLQNLYQNMNELQTRSHSATYFFNYLFFLIPLLLWFREPRKLLLAAGYLTFISYVVIHSFLHFYGWKWEPRMLFDISFIFYLISAYGIETVYTFSRRYKSGSHLVIIALTIYSLFVLCIDLPARYSGEYFNYSVSPPNIRDQVVEKNIHNAIIFFGNQDIYAPYSPFNSVTFDGDIIYAVSQKSNKDELLIKKHPGRSLYYTPDALRLEHYKGFPDKNSQ